MNRPLAGLLLTALAAPAAAKTPAWESWVVSWDLARSTQAAERLGATLSDIGVFAYHFDSHGHVVPASAALASALAALRQSLPAAKLWVTFTNDREAGGKIHLKDPAIMHKILKDLKRRARFIQELTLSARKADGLEIDVENLLAKDRDAFSDFIRALAEGLHAQQKRLSVVVQARTHDRIQDGAGAMDWTAIAAAADRVKLMAYHFHYSAGKPGPVAPPEWVVQLARYTGPNIPPEKLGIVLTLSGFDWPENGPGRSIGYEDALARAQKAGVPVERDAATGSPHFSYVENGLRHSVWFEDAASLQKKIDALHDTGVFQIAIWRLGTGDPAFWDALAKSAR